MIYIKNTKIKLVVNKASSTLSISSSSIDKIYGNSSFSLSNLVSTNNPGVLSFTSGDLNVISITGNVATIVGAGTTTINVTVSSSSNYNGSSTIIPVVVNKIAPTLNLSSSSINKTFGEDKVNLLKLFNKCDKIRKKEIFEPS